MLGYLINETVEALREVTLEVHANKRAKYLGSAGAFVQYCINRFADGRWDACGFGSRTSLCIASMYRKREPAQSEDYVQLRLAADRLHRQFIVQETEDAE